MELAFQLSDLELVFEAFRHKTGFGVHTWNWYWRKFRTGTKLATTDNLHIQSKSEGRNRVSGSWHLQVFLTHREGFLPTEKVQQLSLPGFTLAERGYHVTSRASGRLAGRVEQHGT